MDPAEFKRAVWGPVVLLGHASTNSTRCRSARPSRCADEVCQRLATVGRGGGLIIGPTHHVQLDTPMENLWAMVRTITETPLT